MALSALTAALLLFPTVLVGLWWIRNYKFVLYGPPSVPFIARMRLVRSEGGVELFRLLTKVCYKFGRKTGIFVIQTVYHPIFIVTKAETAEVLLTSSKNISKSLFYQFLVPWLGTGLLISTGAKWHSRRRLLTPTFHFKILEDFLQIFNEQSVVMIDKLDSNVGKGRFEMTPYVTLCALDIICGTAMGKNINAQSLSDSEYVKSIYRVSDIIMNRLKSPWQWPNFIFDRMSVGVEHKKCIDTLHAFTDKVIKERRAEIEERRRADGSAAAAAAAAAASHQELAKDDDEEHFGSKPRRKLAFLDLLLETSSGNDGALTNDDIREEVDTFMFEGHDTTAAAINWAVHLVGANPAVQKKLHEELDRVFGDSNRPVTMGDIKELKYLECVIFPSVPFFARLVTDDCKAGDFVVPKGSTAIIVTPFVHMDPKHFPDPERFDPDRWLPDNSVGRHPFAFIAFSAGPRNCIGQKFAMMEEKVLLTYIFRKFKVTSTQTRDELRPTAELITRPEKGIFVEIEGRLAPASH